MLLKRRLILALVPAFLLVRSARAKPVPKSGCWRCSEEIKHGAWTTYCSNPRCYVSDNVWRGRFGFYRAALKKPEMINWLKTMRRNMIYHPERYYTGHLLRYGVEQPPDMIDNGYHLVFEDMKIVSHYGKPSNLPAVDLWT